ncbi:T9SS type A sorting domain-containing protein [Chitinispirillales bacterium ANBcel5]|uniref:pectate lyase family protein n=1 Tax=Cellulosispirillum alkaliphilum TaxID=3039283 RepID=UPI002A51BC26|nr:T9SS type A sorting domain-containing protein [Chitinispirillales bacterium ANBcel5]
MKFRLYKLLSFLIIMVSFSYGEPDFSLVGFASMNGGTTGGAGGDVFYASEYAAAGYDNPGEYVYQLLRSYRDGNYSGEGEARIIIYIDVTIHEDNFGRSKMNLKDMSNVSIIGVEDKGIFTGVGWTVSRANNVIFRNLTIHHVSQGEGTGIELTNNSHNIWIDRNTFFSEGPDTFDDKDYYDGLVDIKRGVEYVTVSWNIFQNSWKASLLGHNDNASLAPDKITYHHNIYRNINSRTPLIRFATVHTFNNYFKDIESSAINCRMGAQVKIENNYFDNVGSGTEDGHAGYIQGPVGHWYGSSEQGYWDVTGNIVVNSPTDHMESNTSVDIPYHYSHVLHDAADIPELLLQWAGAPGSLPDSNDPVDPVDPVDPGTEHFILSLHTEGNGFLEKSPNQEDFPSETVVEITASALSNWEFYEWSGDLDGNVNPVSVTMDSDKNITAVFVYTGEGDNPEPDFSLQGFAGVGFEVTGGEGGEVVTVSTAEELIDYMFRQEPYVILIDGEIELPENPNSPHGKASDRMHEIAPNKTLFGLEGAHITRGGFNIRGTRNNGEAATSEPLIADLFDFDPNGEITPNNIIIRNITFSDAVDDAINIEEGASHIWIDHNLFINAADGAIDIKREASYITISWNEFRDNDKTSLVGHADNHTYDRGFMKVTYHHNLWTNNNQRQPRVRFGDVHVFNNYYYTEKRDYIWGVGVEASIISENNHIERAHRIARIYGGEEISDIGSIFPGEDDMDHPWEDGFTAFSRDQMRWNPISLEGYRYTLNAVEHVEYLVNNYAGVGVISYEDIPTSIVRSSNVTNEFDVVRISQNPFYRLTEVTFSLSEGSTVGIELLDIRGRVLESFTGSKPVGVHTHMFDVSRLSSGLYLVRLRAGKNKQVKSFNIYR